MIDPRLPAKSSDTQRIAVDGLRQNGASDTANIRQMIDVLWRGRWLLLATMAACMTVAILYSALVAERTYTARTQLVLEADNQPLVDIQSVVSGASTEQAAINTELEIIKSRGMIEQLVDAMNLVEDSEFNSTLVTPRLLSKATIKDLLGVGQEEMDAEAIRNQTVSDVILAVSVAAQRNTYVFSITVTTKDPEKSQEMANRLAQIYLDDQVSNKFDATDYAIDYLSDRVSELETELRNKQNRIGDLRFETDLINQDVFEALNARAKGIRERLQDAEKKQLEFQQKIVTLSEAIQSGDQPELRQQLLNSRMLTPNMTVDDMRDAARNLREQVTQQQSLINTFRQSYDETQTELNTQRKDLQALDELERDAALTQVLYETFLGRLKEASAQIGMQKADGRILSLATPGKQVSPRITMNTALAIILGAMLGTAVILMREMRAENSIRSVDELQLLTNAPVLGEVPVMPIRTRPELLHYLLNKPTSAAAEAIRNLRTSVMMTFPTQDSQVIISTSSLPGEGKTTQSVALATHFAALGRSVLLVEGDVRRRNLDAYFGGRERAGLHAAISGSRHIQDAAFLHEETGINVLLSEGYSGSAADLYSSRSFVEFISEARRLYDIIIIDTPPILLVPDARLIGALCDIVLFTVCWDRTTRSQVSAALRQMEIIGENKIGMVLAQINMRRARGYGDGYSYSYAYTYDETANS